MKMNQNSMRKIVVVAGMLFVSELSLLFADPTVTDVVAKQRYPWNGLVDITCTVSGINAESDNSFVVAAVMPDTGEARKVSQFWVVRNGTNSTDRTVSANGSYRLLWDASADLGQVSYDNMVMRVTVTEGAGGGGSSGGLGGVQLWDNGPYWAECNVGASKPEEYGYYFWWGDTVGYTRSGGTWNDDEWGGYYSGVTWVSSTGQQMSSSPFSPSSCPTYNKNNSALQSAGYIDSTGNLVAAHDAATAHLGAPWRMPTSAEIQALDDNCTTTWITTNGVSGRLVTGKDSYANRSIFLPAAGWGYDSCLYGLGLDGRYWSSTPNSDDSDFAWELYFDSGYFDRGYNYRYYGRSVRPVRGFAE